MYDLWQNVIKLEVTKIFLISPKVGYSTVYLFVVVIVVLRQSHSIIQANLELTM